MGGPGEFVAECFWSGVSEDAVRELDERIRETVAQMSADGRVRYEGSLLMPTDEVVLFLFEGSEDLVRVAAERAAVPFDRILPSSSRSAVGADRLLGARSGDGVIRGVSDVSNDGP
jgi:hypothetical protein